MKPMKTRFVKKLKSIRAADYLKQDRVLRVISAADGFVDFLPTIANPITRITNGSIGKVPQKQEDKTVDLEDEEEASASFADDKENSGPGVNRNDRDLGNCREFRQEMSPTSDAGIRRTSFGSGFRRPDLNSSSLFDPKLLEAFEQAAECYRRISRRIREITTDEEYLEEDDTTLTGAEDTERESRAAEENIGKNENAIPETIEEEREGGAVEEDAGKDGIALPETSKSGREAEDDEGNVGEDEKDENTLPEIVKRKRKSGAEEEEDGNALLETSNSDRETAAEGEEEEDSVGKDENALHGPLLCFEERCPPGGEDSVVFYTTTLRGIRKTFDDCNKIRFLLDSFRVLYYERDVSMHREYKEELWRIMEGKSTLPALFVKGKCIGGAQQVLGLHEQGKLRVLFDSVPITRTQCSDCDGIRFLMCFNCRGSRKIVSDEGARSDCLVCNENGLIVCPNCCL